MSKAIRIHAHGGPEVMQLLTEEMPEPAGQQVRVKVLASGVAYGDIYLRSGFVPLTSFPVTPGYDFVGIIDYAPQESSIFKQGDFVAGLPMLGSYSKYICIDQDRLVAVPEGLDPAEAVSVILNYTTAYQLLKYVAKLNPGDSALVHAAAGGVGTALLQLAQRQGIEVFGTADTRKLNLVKELGATPIDYKNTDFVTEMKRMKPEGVTAVFDAIGGTHLIHSNAVVKKGGTLVAYGITGDVQQKKHPALSVLQTLFLFARLKLTPNSKKFVFGAINATKDKTPESLKNDMKEMLSMLRRKEISPVIAARFPLKDAVHAHEVLESSKTTGKIVLVRD